MAVYLGGVWKTLLSSDWVDQRMLKSTQWHLHWSLPPESNLGEGKAVQTECPDRKVQYLVGCAQKGGR